MSHTKLKSSAVFTMMAIIGYSIFGLPTAKAQVSFGSVTGTLSSIISTRQDFDPSVTVCESNPPVSGLGPHSVSCSGAGAQVNFTAVVTLSATPAGGNVSMQGNGTVQVPSTPPPPEVGAFGGYAIDVPFTLAAQVTASIGLNGFGTITDAQGFEILRRGDSAVLNPGNYVFHGSGGIQNSNVPGGFLNDSRCGVSFSVVGFDPPREFTWAGPSGGVFSEPTNWDPEENAPPTHDGLSGDTAIFETLFDAQFNPITNYSVSASGATSERFIIDQVALSLVGSAQLFETSSFVPSLSLIRGGRLLLNNGASLAGIHGSVGFNPPSPGVVAGMELDGSSGACSFSGRLIIGEFSSGEVFLSGGATLSCDQAIVGDVAAGQVSINGSGSRWNTNSLVLGAISADGALEVIESGRVEVVNQMAIGDFSTARLALIDGGKVQAGTTTIGANAGGVGIIELNGDEGIDASLLEVNGVLRVGVAGSGTLEIRKGSSVLAGELQFAPTVFGGSHVIVAGTDIDGAASDLTVFSSSRLSHGQIEVFDGAHANFADLSLGAGGITEAVVQGLEQVHQIEAAKLTASRLTIGFDDFGTLRVETGGHVVCSEMAVNSLATGGIGRIIVSDGLINVNGTLRVSGDFQQGENVVIEAAGLMSADALRLGEETSSDAAEIVVRDGTPGNPSVFLVLNSNPNAECSIGKDGPGVIRLENRGNVLIQGAARVGGSSGGGEGFVEVGSECSVSVRDLEVGGASPGTVKLLADSSFLNVTGIATVNGGGRIEGVGTITGTRLRNSGGFISPGLSPGTLTIEGDYEQGEGGTLVIEIAGLEAGHFDVLKVTGNASLGGTLLVKFIDGFVPNEGDAMRMLDIGGTVVGQFAELRVEGLPDGQTLSVDPINGQGFVEAIGPVVQPPTHCGTGLCGAGFASLFCVSACALWMLRPVFRRSAASAQKRR